MDQGWNFVESSAELFDCLERWTFQTTFCFPSFRKSAKMLNKLPVTPFYFDLKMRHLCQILLIALEISRKIPLSSKASLNDWCILCSVDMNHLCLKHDWFDDIIFYVMKNSSKLLYIESLEAMKHAGIFLSLIFFLNWHQISFFPFIRKLTSFENYLKRFQNRLPNKLSNTEYCEIFKNILSNICKLLFLSGHDRQQWFTFWEKILLIFIDFAMVELI